MFEGAWIIILLSVMNIMVMIYCIHLFRYHVKALKFLRNAVNVITENGELDELEDLIRTTPVEKEQSKKQLEERLTT